jgi:hypothetical protein
MFCLIPKSRHNSFMNPELNCDPRSLIMVSGIPWFQNTRSRNILAAPSLVMVVLHSCTIALFPCLSTMTNIALYPFDSGNGPIRSHEIICHGRSGIRLGHSGACRFVRSAFVLWHRSHAWQYFVMSSAHAVDI